MKTHLVKGLLILWDRWSAGPRKWAGESSNWAGAAVRWCLLGAAGLTVFRVLTAVWWLWATALLVIIMKALRAATAATQVAPEKPEEPALDRPVEVPGLGLPHVTRDQFLTLLHDTLGTAKGVHLRTLAAALTVKHGGAWGVGDVRALCDDCAVPTRPTVRAPGGGPTVGVHRADLDALPRPLPEPGPVPDVADYTAGQSATTTPTTPAPTTPTTPTSRRVGDVLVIATDDPDNPARTHVRVIESARKRA